MQYLFGRGIDYQLIQECIADGTIYESADYHNAVFVGKDKSGMPKYAALRSTLGSPFKQDASGSDKRYSFRLLAKEPINTVHLFEAAIDLLSYATYLKCEGKDSRTQNLLSLSGVYQPKKELSESKVPIALSTYLKENPQVKTVVMNRPELFHVGMERRKLCLNVLAVLLQLLTFPAPCGDGHLAILEIRFQLALCHVERPQRIVMLRLVLLAGFFKTDGFQLVRSGLARLVVVHHPQQFVHFFDTGLL